MSHKNKDLATQHARPQVVHTNTGHLYSSGEPRVYDYINSVSKDLTGARTQYERIQKSLAPDKESHYTTLTANAQGVATIRAQYEDIDKSLSPAEESQYHTIIVNDLCISTAPRAEKCHFTEKEQYYRTVLPNCQCTESCNHHYPVRKY